MISANQSNSAPIYGFRLKVITKILNLEPQVTHISRREQFLAVTLFDQHLLKIVSAEPASFCPPEEKLLPFCVTCLKLACKFESQYNPKIEALAAHLRYQGDLQVLKALCMEAETEILLQADFTMPSENFYTNFQVFQTQSTLTERQACYFLKFFITALQFSTELTQNADYGRRIYQRLMKKQSQDQRIGHYLETIIAWSKVKSLKASQK